MVKFIEFEADENVRNIDAQSEDECHIIKNEILLKGKTDINQFYNKKTNLMKRTTAT